eukprot:gene434-biopygen7606
MAPTLRCGPLSPTRLQRKKILYTPGISGIRGLHIIQSDQHATKRLSVPANPQRIYVLWDPAESPVDSVLCHMHFVSGDGVLGETAEDASGTRPVLRILSCGTRPGRVRGRFSLHASTLCGCDGVAVSTRGGRVYHAREVISTLPLGTLQRRHTQLFDPPLGEQDTGEHSHNSLWSNVP